MEFKNFLLFLMISFAIGMVIIFIVGLISANYSQKIIPLKEYSCEQMKNSLIRDREQLTEKMGWFGFRVVYSRDKILLDYIHRCK